MPYRDSEYPSILRGRDKRESQRLLTAAPFMLTALEEIAEGCQRRLSKGYDNGDAWTLRVCRTAIAKAEGSG